MTITNYGTLKTNVRSWFSDRSDIPALVYDLATAELNERLRLVIMESTATLAVSGESTALPADFLEVRHAYLDKNPRVRMDMADVFSKNTDYKSSGEPRTYTIVDGFFLLNPVPDGSYSVVLRYIAKLADFTDDTDTNAVLTTHPALYLYASLKQAAMWAMDAEAAASYERWLEMAAKGIVRSEQAKRYGSGPLRSRAANAP